MNNRAYAPQKYAHYQAHHQTQDFNMYGAKKARKTRYDILRQKRLAASKRQAGM